jgi:hypothetical protein
VTGCIDDTTRANMRARTRAENGTARCTLAAIDPDVVIRGVALALGASLPRRARGPAPLRARAPRPSAARSAHAACATYARRAPPPRRGAGRAPAGRSRAAGDVVGSALRSHAHAPPRAPDGRPRRRGRRAARPPAPRRVRRRRAFADVGAVATRACGRLVHRHVLCGAPCSPARVLACLLGAEGGREGGACAAPVASLSRARRPAGREGSLTACVVHRAYRRMLSLPVTSLVPPPALTRACCPFPVAPLPGGARALARSLCRLLRRVRARVRSGCASHPLDSLRSFDESADGPPLLADADSAYFTRADTPADAADVRPLTDSLERFVRCAAARCARPSLKFARARAEPCRPVCRARGAPDFQAHAHACSAAQRSAAQRSAAQRSAAQRSAAQRSPFSARAGLAGARTACLPCGRSPPRALAHQPASPASPACVCASLASPPSLLPSFPPCPPPSLPPPSLPPPCAGACMSACARSQRCPSSRSYSSSGSSESSGSDSSGRARACGLPACAGCGCASVCVPAPSSVCVCLCLRSLAGGRASGV